MTVLADRRTDDRTGYLPRMHRRHEIVASGGVSGALAAGEALAGCGYPVRDLTVDVREGVAYSSLLCTVSLTAAESATFAERILSCSTVVAVTAC